MKTIQQESTIVESMQNLKVIIDNLTLINHHLSDKEVIIHTLNDLRDKYQKLIVAISVHDSHILFKKLYHKLFVHKTYLKWEEKTTWPTIIAQFHQRSKGKDNQGNQSNKNINKNSNKMHPRHMENNFNYYNYQEGWCPNNKH